MNYLLNRILLKSVFGLMVYLTNISLVLADSFPGCLISNPCDCECNDYNETWPESIMNPILSPPVTETYRGFPIKSETYTGSSNCACPPYNKNDGRTGCLLNPSGPGYPGIFDMAYMNICAEASPPGVTTYFHPKIRYRTQACNIACWTLSGDLEGDGECTVIPAPYGIPTIRLCARMAMPADPLNNRSADEGYTPDVHLNIDGYLVDDNPLSNGGYDTKGEPISMPDPRLQVPKICLYWDPDLWDTLLSELYFPIVLSMTPIFTNLGIDPAHVIDGLLDPDFMDFDPTRQPQHHSPGTNPVVQLMIDLIEFPAEFMNAISNMIDSLPDYIKYTIFILTELEYLLKALSWLIESVGVPVLKFIGNINRVVAASFGCVLVPLGVFPPPYCPTITPSISIPSAYEICPTTVLNDGSTIMVQKSTSQDPCKNANPACVTPQPFGLCMMPKSSMERNNAVHNLIRVSFSHKVPLCKSSSEDTANGQCVHINGSTAPSYLHSFNNNSGIIPLCTSIPAPLGQSPCVESKYMNAQCISANCANPGVNQPSYCCNGLQVLYSMGITSSEYYDASVPDCNAPGLSGCQFVYGVNAGSFADLAVTFQNDDKSDPKWSSPVTLLDNSGVSHTYAAAIPRSPQKIDSAGLSTQDPSTICVYEINASANPSTYTAVGCSARATPPKPKLYDCKLDGSCTSNYWAPAMIVSLKVPTGKGGIDYTQNFVSVDNTLNLAGFNYSAYATDSTFAKKPFTGSHSILNSSSIYGNYLNDSAPYDVRGNFSNPPPTYLNGIEYLNSVYQVGVENLCLTGYKVDDCFSGQTKQNCVLSDLVNTDIISCKQFKQVLQKYSGIDVCNPNNPQLNCDYTRNGIEYSVNGFNNNVVNVRSCVSKVSGLTTYCYDYGPSGGPYGEDGGALCQSPQDGTHRIVPNTNADILPSGYVPNVNFYAYQPGVASAGGPTYTNTSANASLAQSVVDKAQSVASTPITSQYAQAICTADKTLTVVDSSYNSLMTACSKTLYISSQINKICTQVQQLLSGNIALTNACNTAATNIQNIVNDQKNASTILQIQNDATKAQTELNTLMNAISSLNNQSVLNAAQAIQKAANTTTYTLPLCTTNPAFTTAAYNMMQSCTTARGALDMVTAICTQTEALIKDNTSTLYTQLKNACTEAVNKVNGYLSDQRNTQLLSQMQTDTSSSKQEVSNLLLVINNLLANPMLIKNIISTEQAIYNSTDNITYPNASSKITAICTQVKALVQNRVQSPIMYDALSSACSTAQKAPTNASLTALNDTIVGFKDYDISQGGDQVSGNKLSNQIVPGAYVAPDYDTMVVRNRTNLENNLCVEIPQPTCAAVNSVQAHNYGNATWTSAASGKYSIGTCINGYAPTNGVPLKAYCLLNRSTRTVSLDPAVTRNACMVSSINMNLTQQWDANIFLPNSLSTYYRSMNNAYDSNSGVWTSTFGTAGGWDYIGCGGPCSSGACNATCVNNSSTFTFNINNKNDLNFFNLVSVGIDDYILVTVNGNYIFAGSGKGTFTTGNAKNQYDQWRGAAPDSGWHNYNLNMNIIPYLRNGSNTIIVNTIIVNGGNYQMTLQYKWN